MKAKSSSKSALFLIELIIAIAFFAVTSAICAQLFVKAHLLSVGSRDLSRSITAAQSAAECFKATGADADEIAHLLGAQATQNTVNAYYNSQWLPVSNRDPNGYTMTMTMRPDGVLIQADIVVISEKSSEELYALQAAHYE